MTRNFVLHRFNPAIVAAMWLVFALCSTLVGRAQTTRATNTVVTTTVTTTATATNTSATTNITTTITVTPAPVKWDTTATFALTVTGGNTKTLLTTLDFNTQRKTPKNEFLFDVNGTYGENNAVKNAEQLDGNGQYNRIAIDDLYYGIKVDGYHDGIAGIDYRLTVSPLVGYYFIKNPGTFLVGEVGPGYIYQRQEGSDTTSSQAALRAGERFEHKFNAATKIWQDVEFIPQVNNFGDWYADGEIGFDTSITKHAAITTFIQDTYYNVPTPGRLHNDVKLVTGITYKF